MTKADDMYKCEICGNMVSVVESGKGVLVCCGQDMKLMEEQTKEQEGREKHVPMVSVENGRVNVKVGSIGHPMEEEHYIELVQLVKDGKVIAGKKLKPGEKPEAEFCLDDTEGISARILCNVHGLWVN